MKLRECDQSFIIGPDVGILLKLNSLLRARF